VGCNLSNILRWAVFDRLDTSFKSFFVERFYRGHFIISAFSAFTDVGCHASYRRFGLRAGLW
jgi:hypothetical protein